MENKLSLKIKIVCVQFVSFLIVVQSLEADKVDSGLHELDFPIIIHSGSNKGVFISTENGCHVIHHSRTNWLHKFDRYQSYKISPPHLDDIIKLCEDYEHSLISPTEFVTNLHDHHRLSQFIYPGTKYCGPGNSSSHPNELGEYKETDKCCREHDNCQDYVVGFSCHPTNGLCNYTPFTRSSCTCDDKFRKCLLAANEPISNRIGKLFFNVFGLKCYRKDYPIIQCQRYGGFMYIHCQKYQLDRKKQPILQFFDSPTFIPLSQIENEKNEEILIDGLATNTSTVRIM